MIAGLQIVLAREDELPVVRALMMAAFAEYAGYDCPSSALRETEADVRRAAAEGGAILAKLDDRVVGSGRFTIDDGALFYERLAVHPASRGRGVGRAMVEWLEARARALGLCEIRTEARSQQPDNRPFYLARGYEIAGYDDDHGIPNLSTRLRKRLPEPT
jgi:GNAT superfamily N-acetyltransferase